MRSLRPWCTHARRQSETRPPPRLFVHLLLCAHVVALHRQVGEADDELRLEADVIAPRRRRCGSDVSSRTRGTRGLHGIALNGGLGRHRMWTAGFQVLGGCFAPDNSSFMTRGVWHGLCVVEELHVAAACLWRGFTKDGALRGAHGAVNSFWRLWNVRRSRPLGSRS